MNSNLLIIAVALLPLSTHAANFSPLSTRYKLPATFHFTVNGVHSDCTAMLRGSTIANGKLRINGFTSKCLIIGNLPRIALATGVGVGRVGMSVTYGSNLCGGTVNLNDSSTGLLQMSSPLGVCTFTASGQFTPVITIVP